MPPLPSLVISAVMQLLAVHATAGCDTVSYMFGKGKVSTVTIIQKHDSKLDTFRDRRADLPYVLKTWP